MPKKLIVPFLSGHLQTVASKLPTEIVEYIDKAARKQMRTRSDIVRTLVVEALRKSGVVATDEAEAAA